MKRNLLWLVLALICFARIISAQVTTPVSAVRAYTVGPGDEITVKVLGEKDFDAVATVDENGNLELPFLDAAVPAMCKTERELKADITKLLSKYLRSPQVGLSVTKRNSRPPVTVAGEVKTQGQVSLTRKTRLWELITFSGGPTDDAGGMIEVFRTQPPLCAEPQELAVWKADAANQESGGFARLYSISSVQQGKDETNPIIYPGDVINVQKGKPVYIVGEIKGGQGGLMIKEGGLQLTQAIAMAGGVSREAKTKDIKIYRRKTDSIDREVISVNLNEIKKDGKGDIALEPYDIVEVGKAGQSVGKILLQAVTGSVGSGIGAFATSGATRVLY